jgi:putative transposase
MPNHVHLILVPSTPEGLSDAVGQVHQRYTRRINFRRKWRGYLWQGRFGSFVLDDTHLLRAAAYVERNPVAAGLADEAAAWAWSSAGGHVAGRGDAVAEGDWLADRIGAWVCTWGQYLAETAGEDTGKPLRRHESTGRPLGDRNFVEQVSAAIGRDSVPRKPGRKPKKEK